MREQRIAVVGMSCRFAGAHDSEQLWKLMLLGKSQSASIGRRFPEFGKYYHPDSRAEGKFYNKEAYFLTDNIDLFDADFFHISYKEAKRMDYQQRLLLEVSCEALQNAGIEIRGSDAGIFIGVFMQDFLTNTMQRENYGRLSSLHATGSSIGMLASRLSYFYDVHGPSMAVDTACSSSLTALYLAVESIRSGKCSVALCGGVTILTEPGNFITLSKGGFLSPKSRSAAFGAEADGYARGEGVGVLVLKRWDEAVRDRDPVLCEIVQVRVNHDGNKKGITYPNGQAQTALLRQIYETGGISAEDIGYLEAHGTGTRIGDRVEAEALQQVFGGRKNPLYIGSVKTNIGHTEAAAGMASVIKGILILQHGLIPPSLHCREKNSNIPFERYGLIPVQKETTLQAAGDGRTYIGINGFGFGGANAHVVIGSCEEESGDAAGQGVRAGRREEERRDTGPEHTLYLAANSLHSLKCLAGAYQHAIQHGELRKADLDKICECAAQRRFHDLPCRLAVTAENIPQMAEQLAKFERDETDRRQMCRCSDKKYRRLMAVFSGMGIQTEDMGKELYRAFPVFRDSFHACSMACVANGGRDLEAVIREENVPEDFYRVGFLQPYHLAYQISLFKLLCSMGLTFDGCVGHSAGELAAFYCSGFLTLDETFRVACHRGACQELLQGKGKMLALKLDRESAVRICVAYEGKISLAVENGQNAVVLSGDYETLSEIAGKREGQFLKGSVAYHSVQMEEIRERLCRRIGQSEAETPVMPLYSTVYGRNMERGEYDGSYWWMNVRNTVEFHRTLQEIRRAGYDAFAEIGVTPVLSHYIAQQYQKQDFTCITIQSKRQKGTEAEQLYRGVMQAYVNHVPMDFRAETKRCGMLPLPLYAWDYKTLAVETPIREGTASKTYLGDRLPMPQEMWENRLNLYSHDFLADHKIGKACYLPAAFYIAMLSEAKITLIKGMIIKRPVVLGSVQDLVLNLIRHSDGSVEVSAAGSGRDDWRSVMQCEKAESRELHGKRLAAEQMQEMRRGRHISGGAVYCILREKSLCYEGSFCRISEAWVGEDSVCSRIEPVAEEREYAALLDAMLQTAALAQGQGKSASWKGIMLPVGVGEIRLYGLGMKKKGSLYAEARVRESAPGEWTADISLYGERGERLVDLKRTRFKRKRRAEESGREIYTREWEETEMPAVDAGRAGKNILILRAGNFWLEDMERLLAAVKEWKPEDGPVLVVTEHAVKVSAVDSVCNYRQAALWGAVRCLRAERPDVPLYLLDTDKPEILDLEQTALCGGLPEGEYELAVRDKKVYGCRIRQKKLETGKTDAQSGRVCTEQGERGKDTAVITGASGGVAFSYALYLAAQGIGHIVLISRHRMARTGILLETLRYYGVDCRFLQADVTNPEQMRQCWKSLQDKKYGAKTVYHLAGYSKDCPAEQITPELMEEHMRPKLEGAMCLSKLVKETGDRLVLIGSVTALLGNPGQSCYAAANMAMQSFGAYAGHKTEGFGALDTGMAVRSETVRQALTRQGIVLMDSREAIERVEVCDEEVCFAADLDWHKLAGVRRIDTDHKFRDVMQTAGQEDDFRKEYDAADTVEKERMLIEEMRRIYAQILEMQAEEVSPDRNTDTMGIDSLGAAFISARIQERLKADVMPDMVSGPFTIRNMAMRMVLEIEKKEEGMEEK